MRSESESGDGARFGTGDARRAMDSDLGTEPERDRERDDIIAC
jgi:hypothetical protein